MLLTTGEAAKIIGISAQSVRRMIREGRLPAINLAVGRSTRDVFRIDSETVDKFLAEVSINTPPMDKTDDSIND